MPIGLRFDFDSNYTGAQFPAMATTRATDANGGATNANRGGDYNDRPKKRMAAHEYRHRHRSRLQALASAELDRLAETGALT